MDNIGLFRWYAVCKSTAIVVPVLPLLLSEEKGLDAGNIVFISGIFSFVVILLETPLGLWADKEGSKKVIKLAMASMILGFCCLIFLPGEISYYGYMAAIAFAGASLSGAEDSLLLRVCSSKHELFEVKSRISTHVYMWTIVLLLAAGFLYQLNALLPFIAQIFFLGMAIYLCHLINVDSEVHSPKSASVAQLLRSSHQEIQRPYILILIAISSVSAFAVSLANRTGPLVFADVFGDDPALVSSAIFVIGNLSSAQSAVLFRRTFKASESPVVPTLCLGVIAVSSCLMLAGQNIVLVAAGFILLSAFKTGYRNYISSLLILSLRDRESLATTLSISAIISAVVAFVLSMIIAALFSQASEANLFIAGTLFITYGIGLIGLVAFRSESIFVTPTNAVAGKAHFLQRQYCKWTYKQVYPAPDLINEYVLSGEFRETRYPAPALVASEESALEWEYLHAVPLSNLDAEQQLKALQSLSEIFKVRLQEGVQLSHGDLHPDNILVAQDGTLMVVDWDLCGPHHAAFDPLTLFTSPQLKISIHDRLKLLTASTSLSPNEALKKAIGFSQRKEKELSQFSGEFICRISKGYGAIAEEFKSV